MRAFGRWLLFVLAVAGCLGAAYAAYTLANYSWGQVADYRSPYVGLKLPAAGKAQPLIPRTVFVIVDGLTESMSRDLDTVERLRSYGTDYVVTAGQPSLSYPNWTNLLSGAPAQISGVTTNDYVGPVKVETLFQTAMRARVPVVFVGPEDFQGLYDVKANTTASFMQPWSETEYLSALYVDKAIELAKTRKPRLLVVHLPDIDEAGHRAGSSSDDYQRTARKVDADLGRLVTALQDGSTVFVVAADHGHIATGGHGGWESIVTSVPAVFSGPGIAIGSGTASQSDIAPTVALLSGLPVPRFAQGSPLRPVIGQRDTRGLAEADAQLTSALGAYSRVIAAAPPSAPLPKPAAVSNAQQARTQYAKVQADEAGRRSDDAAEVRPCRRGRRRAVPRSPCHRFVEGARRGAGGRRRLLRGVQPAVLRGPRVRVVAVGVQPRRAGGRVHQHAGDRGSARRADRRSGRRSGVPAAAGSPQTSGGGYLAGWLTLGPITLLVAMATLGVQAAIFVWQWGIVPTWRLPDLMWAVKYDFDLIQIVGLGAAVILAPLVTYLVGRYHPKVRRPRTSAAS